MKNLEKAKTLIESNDPEQFYYACLELRYALEKIAYEKLRLRLDKITIDEIAAWQPRRALDRLMDLVDKHLDQDSVLLMGKEHEYGVSPPADEFVSLGRTKGINPKEMGKNWQKLGSYLHIKMPKNKSHHPEKSSSEKLKSYLEDVIKYIDELSNTNIDAHFSPNVTFQCSRCEQTIVRNINLLKDGDVIQCQNNECIASYIVHKEENEYKFEEFLIPLECKKCGKETLYHANDLLKIPYTNDFITKCRECSAQHKVRWNLEYALMKDDV